MNLTRRKFLAAAGTLAATAAGARGARTTGPGDTAPPASPESAAPMEARTRAWQAYRLRVDAAAAQRDQPRPAFPTNGDEERYPDHFASYTKGLAHDERGHVDPASYDSFTAAVDGGRHADVEALILGGKVRLANPLAAHSFELEGADPHQLGIPAPPGFASAEAAAEMVELYWQALTRDVPFAHYEEDPSITAAAKDLSALRAFSGPRAGGVVTPATLFRGEATGDLAGPYLSQFLWLDVQQGIHTLEQRGRVTVAGDDHMTTYAEWLSIQRGGVPARIAAFDPVRRYLRNGRDLAAYLQRDYTYQSFLNACLVLLGIGVRMKTEFPYRFSKTQGGFITFGAPHVLDTVARVANAALKATWCQKWLVHHRVRPEAFAGRVHNHLTRVARYPIHRDLLDSVAVDAVRRRTGSHLLPQAYPEGCPMHPSYPAGHAAIAGACVTVLKAFFDERREIPNPMVAEADGMTLRPWRGARLAVGGELDKLAANIALGRGAAGVHYRSDSIEGLRLGEAVAKQMLGELRATCPEALPAFTFTGFDGVRTSV
jgi:membrane-associated phospholipid phosphatase